MPIAELAIIIQVGQAIGVWWTIAILVVDSILGSVLMRSQGRATWRRFNETMRMGKVPAKEVIDGGLVIFGGACLLTPGFITDLFGLLLLLPPTRAVLRRLLKRFAGRIVAGAASGAGPRMFAFGAPPRSRPRADADDVVDSSATDVDPRRGRLP